MLDASHTQHSKSIRPIVSIPAKTILEFAMLLSWVSKQVKVIFDLVKAVVQEEPAAKVAVLKPFSWLLSSA